VTRVTLFRTFCEVNAAALNTEHIRDITRVARATPVGERTHG